MHECVLINTVRPCKVMYILKKHVHPKIVKEGILLDDGNKTLMYALWIISYLLRLLETSSPLHL